MLGIPSCFCLQCSHPNITDTDTQIFPLKIHSSHRWYIPIATHTSYNIIYRCIYVYIHHIPLQFMNTTLYKASYFIQNPPPIHPQLSAYNETLRRVSAEWHLYVVRPGRMTRNRRPCCSLAGSFRIGILWIFLRGLPEFSTDTHIHVYMQCIRMRIYT